jgi:hypothetical protein
VIVVRRPEDADKIANENHRAILKRIAVAMCEAYSDSKEEDIPFSVYFEIGDDVTKGVPSLSDSEYGLLCKGTLFDGEPQKPGWCWENVIYHAWAKIFEVIIIMNDDFAAGYFVQDTSDMDPELRDALQSQMEIIENRAESLCEL